eukprot:3858467-Rhodomonas_salina.1
MQYRKEGWKESAPPDDPEIQQGRYQQRVPNLQPQHSTTSPPKSIVFAAASVRPPRQCTPRVPGTRVPGYKTWCEWIIRQKLS